MSEASDEGRPRKFEYRVVTIALDQRNGISQFLHDANSRYGPVGFR